MQKIKGFLKAYQWPILSGFLVGTTYIPFFPWALPFCLFPLWFFWYKNFNSLKKLFIGGWISQFIFNMIGFHWVANTAIEFGGFPKPVGFIILLLFSFIAHLYVPVAGVLWGYLKRKCSLSSLQALFLIPLLYALCETLYPTIFFWHLGYTWLWAGFPGSHTAEWIGFYGLQMVTLFANLCFLAYYLLRKRVWLISLTLLLVIPNILGLYLKNRYEEGSEKLQVLIVQANIGNAIKVLQDRGQDFDNYILNKFLQLTDSGMAEQKPIDLILWPETAYPSAVSQKSRTHLQNRLEYFIEAQQIPLLTGAYELDPEKRNVTYNSLVLFDKKGHFVDSYRKTYLLAFGEFFPGAEYFPQLKTWFPMVSDFGRGRGPKVLQLEELKLGAQICYESLFDGFSSELYKQGAQVIVNVTNDSWFGKHFEPYQHLYMTLARAIEFRVPIIRSTNTGISTAIKANGDILPFSPVHEEWTGVFSVNYHKEPRPTLYSYYAGHWHWILLFFCALVLFGEKIAKSRKS